MIKLVWRLFILTVAGFGIVWLADRPGSVTIQWLGREIHLTVFTGLVLLTVLFSALYVLLRIVRRLWRTPNALRGRRKERKTRKAYDALTRGIVAAGAGDAQAAARHAAHAEEVLGDTPLVKLLGAQAAHLRGDRDEVRRVFASMTNGPDTELLGLRGLFAHARDAGDWSGARRHAEKALARNTRLPWAATAVLQSQLAQKDFEGAAQNVAQQGKANLMPRPEAQRKQAALLAAAALAKETSEPARALSLAQEAHDLDPGLVPAAAPIARLQTLLGQQKKALKAIRQTWALSPHRELAALAAQLYADEPEAQFERVRDLTGKEPTSLEGRYALSRAAILAGRHEAARDILQPLLDDRPSASVCALMAEISDVLGDKGESRDWLARALTAPRDPIWVSDGVATPLWTALSPVTGEIVPAEWKPPFEQPIAQMPRFQQLAPAVVVAAAERSDAARALLPRPPDDPGVDQSS
jgi:HemY protein